MMRSRIFLLAFSFLLLPVLAPFTLGHAPYENDTVFPGIDPYHAGPEFLLPDTSKRKNGEYGIKEIIPREYTQRYKQWKDGLLSTEFGRQMWEKYSGSKEFLLTIIVSNKRKFGAGTDGFEWDADGKLIAATVTLGRDIDKGYPDPVYYPVMNSLAERENSIGTSGNILASTKFAHELGHVNFTAQINSKLFRDQNRLMADYYKIFLKNGFDTRDPRLTGLAGELGAKPIEIWEDREYWSEVSAMNYLVERIEKEAYYCSVMNKIRRNVHDYAPNYRSRFEQLTNARPACSE